MPASTQITASLNGCRLVGSHPRLPTSAHALAADALAAAGAGASAVELSVRTPDGATTLDPSVVDETVRGIRTGNEGVTIGVSTYISLDQPADRRAGDVAAWTQPDLVSVRLSDPAHYELMAAALDAGLGLVVSASSPADVQRLTRTGLIDEVSQVLVAPGADGAVVPDQVVMARAVEQALTAAACRAPRIHHGHGAPTWEVLRAAVATGRDVRIGLADTLTGPEGRPAASNAALVRAARKLVEAGSPLSPRTRRAE